MSESEKIYGLTGNVETDGILPPDRQDFLNNLQKRSAEHAFEYLSKMQVGDLKPLIKFATGVGKTRTQRLLIEQQMREKPDSKILVIAGTKTELVRQAHRSLGEQQQQFTIQSDELESEEIEEVLDEESVLRGDTPSMFYMTGKYGDVRANVHIATAQKVQLESNKPGFDPNYYDLVIVDEVHETGTEQKKLAIQDKFRRVVGFTATAHRYSGRMKAPEQYGYTVIEDFPLLEAQKEKILPRLIGMQFDTTGLVEKVPFNNDGSINYRKLERILKNSPDLYPFIAEKIASVVGGAYKYKTIVPVNFVWEAEELARLFKEVGLVVGISVNKQAAREIEAANKTLGIDIPVLDAMERYKLPHGAENGTQLLISPKVAGTGFDAPATEVIAWASPTDSPVRYTQYTGRTARRAPGKKFGLILDFLYQTEKYAWNYNMGMWDPNVKRLENGLLYLGPETDIEDLKQLPQLMGIAELSARKGLDDLQQEGFERIKDTDFPITFSFIDANFVNSHKVYTAALRLFDKFKEEKSTFIGTRQLKNYKPIPVFLDRDAFTKELLAQGYRLKDPDAVKFSELEPIKDTDFLVTIDFIEANFVNSKKVYPAALKLLEEYKKDNSSLIGARRSGTVSVPVFLDRDAFIKKLLAQGYTLKSSQNEEEVRSFVPLTSMDIYGMFSGGSQLLRAANEVKDQLRGEGLVTRMRRVDRGNHEIDVISNIDVFKKLMLERGFVLKDVEKVKRQRSLVWITPKNMSRLFRGDGRELSRLALEIAGELVLEDPSLVVYKRYQKAETVNVNRERLIQMMLLRGVEENSSGRDKQE